MSCENRAAEVSYCRRTLVGTFILMAGIVLLIIQVCMMHVKLDRQKNEIEANRVTTERINTLLNNVYAKIGGPESLTEPAR